jgi:AcrR family transcriptional regulator
MNQRQYNAQLTKDKVYQSAIELFESKGFDNITVDEVCFNAGVSTGTFYNVFKSKNEILDIIFEKADTYFNEIVVPALQTGSTKEKILLFFDYYADYNLQCGIRFTKQLYAAQSKLFIKSGRSMQVILANLLEEGVTSQSLHLPMEIDDAVRFLFIHVRGLVYNWCLHDGEIDLKGMIQAHVGQLMDAWLIS